MRRRLWSAAVVVGFMAASQPMRPAAVQEVAGAPRSELSRDETEARVKADAAHRFRVELDRIRVIEAADRTWPDAGLGCASRRGVLGSWPAPGFRFVVAAGRRQLTYHTDRHGRLLRCAAPRKPLDRIK